SALVLLPPTLLMGGTLPAAAKSCTAAGDARRRSAALLYGLNTLGAVAGALASTFVLLERYGTRRTLWLACLLNAAVAVSAHVIDRLDGWVPAFAGTTGEPEPEPAPVPDLTDSVPPGFTLLAAAIT